ncbi:FAD binding domain-containing protein [Bisporella sp. PMI_857]|nr:FAD binding domain-containing protein [Bisporella sp. PMI_857]
MKRTRSQASSNMSPGASNEGFISDVDVPVVGDRIEDVVIAGAGPAGLMLASNLTRYGIKPKIVDDRSDKTSTGRADGLQPKTIETFKQLGLADGLLRKGVKIYDICFWNSTPSSPLSRQRREVHYPPELDVKEPFVLLVHQGMIEDIFIADLRDRRVEVARNSAFASYQEEPGKSNLIKVNCYDKKTSTARSLYTRYLVGCDGARSQVRTSIPGTEMVGDSTRAPWGVLDGVIETDFPDLWSKVVVHSEEFGTILCIPRERNMTRLYIELNPKMKDVLSSEDATQDFVMKRAQQILTPFTLKWRSVEWFSVYKVGQRVANKFTNDSERVFITGDAAHTHSPKAAQGMNVSMHDSFNLSWKLNLAIRGLATPALLSTYEAERRKIAQDLINFDFEHASAFAAGDAKALAANFITNIGFISGIGAKYAPNVLNVPSPRVAGLQAGALLSPARVTRFIDANPVDAQLDIPMLGQFRIYFFTPNPKFTSALLTAVSTHLFSLSSVLGRATSAAAESYASQNITPTEADEFVQPHRYTAVSMLFTPALVTTLPKDQIEIGSLPPLFKDSRWTFYIDDLMNCTQKWIGDVVHDECVILNVRPDGYVGSLQCFTNVQAADACQWLDSYYSGFLKS